MTYGNLAPLYQMNLPVRAVCMIRHLANGHICLGRDGKMENTDFAETHLIQTVVSKGSTLPAHPAVPSKL